MGDKFFVKLQREISCLKRIILKIRLYILLGCLFFTFSCKTDSKPSQSVIQYKTLNGKTMGTSYTIKYLDSLNRDFQSAIDQLLVEVNDEVSTYEPESFITRFNKSQEDVQYFNLLNKNGKGPLHFKANFEKAGEVYKNSNGYFDPTIMPIVNYWGFGYTEKRPVLDIDKLKVDSLMQYVGFEKITQRSTKDGWIYLHKKSEGVQLDFSAIAKGYGVDAVAMHLEEQGIGHYYVEIGGELRVKGKNPQQDWWTVGINKPKEDAALTEIQAKIKLKNQAMATSGNYRNYYEVEGVKYAHTINCKTGLPEKNTLLSATLLAEDCMTADAYATACMAMGLERSKAMLSNLEGIEAYFLYSDENGVIKAEATNPEIGIFQ